MHFSSFEMLLAWLSVPRKKKQGGALASNEEKEGHSSISRYYMALALYIPAMSSFFAFLFFLHLLAIRYTALFDMAPCSAGNSTLHQEKRFCAMLAHQHVGFGSETRI
jgi:hypothetical protein